MDSSTCALVTCVNGDRIVGILETTTASYVTLRAAAFSDTTFMRQYEYDNDPGLVKPPFSRITIPWSAIASMAHLPKYPKGYDKILAAEL